MDIPTSKRQYTTMNDESSMNVNLINDDEEEQDDANSDDDDPNRYNTNESCATTTARHHLRRKLWWLKQCRIYAVVLSVGAISFAQVYHDSIVDNLFPIVQPSLLKYYGTVHRGNGYWSALVAMRTIGLLIGCLCSIAAEPYGRRRPLLFSACLLIIGGLLCATTVHMPGGLAAAIFGRLLIGFGSGMAQVVGSAFLAEIPPIDSRGIVLATLTAWACLGELGGMLMGLPELFGTIDHWPLAMAFGVVPVPIALIILIYAPESPRYLMLNNRVADAHRSLRFYQSKKDWKSAIDDIQAELASSMKSRNFENYQLINNNNEKSNRRSVGNQSTQPYFGYTLDDIGRRLRDRRFVAPLFLAMIIEGFIHIDDWIWLSYSTEVFLESGISEYWSQYASVLMTIPQAIISISLTFCFEQFSRKNLLALPTLGSAIFSFLAIVCMAFGNGGYGHRNRTAVIAGASSSGMKSLVPVLASLDLVMAAIASESAYAVVPELFGQEDRILGTALAGAFQNLVGATISFVLLQMILEFGTIITLLPFVVVNILYAMFVWRHVPETGGQSFQSISLYFKKPDKPLATDELITDCNSLRKRAIKAFKSIADLSSSTLFAKRTIAHYCVIGAQMLVCAFLITKVFIAIQNGSYMITEKSINV